MLEKLFSNNTGEKVDTIADNITAFAKDWAELLLIISDYFKELEWFLAKWG